jgi:hypothetical protein
LFEHHRFEILLDILVLARDLELQFPSNYRKYLRLQDMELQLWRDGFKNAWLMSLHLLRHQHQRSHIKLNRQVKQTSTNPMMWQTS